MADLNANINVGIETTQALTQLKALQKQISQFHQSVAKSSGQASVAQRDLQRNFLNSVNSIQGFSAELKTVRTTAESFTNSLEKNKFSIRQYFRNAAGASKSFNKNFQAEFSAIEKTAIERVKTLQTQYVKMGRDASGAMQAIAIRPTVLNMKDLGTQTAIAAQKQTIFNQLVKQGSTNLLNFGKNTQWAGRQLMVGFTLPLATLGMVATNVFFKMETAAIKFKKVYGDFFTTEDETKKAMASIVDLGEAYAAYGVEVAATLDIAGDAAAAGFSGVDLQNQTTAALKLSVLGQIDLQKSLATTIALQNAFQLSSSQLSAEIDFLNAVENQTVVALDDITTAIPRVAPVIQALGGDVRDLAFFIAAMKEGGVNAAQGANALKSGLASLINPSEKASAVLARMGINIRGIVRDNEGDLAGTVTAFAKSLDRLDPLRRAQAIEQLFGKFQFARISALFDNISREGTQASRVLDLAGSSASQLAELAEDELGISASSSMNKFKKSVEELKVAIVPVGELFAQIATPFVEFGAEMFKAFNRLPDGVRGVIGSVITILGGIGPIALMTFGLINNGIANMIKFFATVRLGYLKITGQAAGIGDETQYMTQEQLEAAAAAASLDQAHAGLVQRFTVEKVAVDELRAAYEAAAAAGARFATLNPGMMRPVSATQAQGFADGGFVSGPGTGTSDSIPVMLSNGEAVIPAEQAKQYAALINAMIAGNLPGYKKGLTAQASGTGEVSFGGEPFSVRAGSEARIMLLIDSFQRLEASSSQISEILNEAAEKGKITIKALEEAASSRGMLEQKSEKIVLGHLQGTKSVDPVTGERRTGSLVRRMTQSQNKLMDTPAGQSVEDFSADWKRVTGGLNESVKLGGLELTEAVAEAAQNIDNEIHDLAVEMANGASVTGPMIEDATNIVLEGATKAKGALEQVAKILQSVRDDPRFDIIKAPTVETLRAAGLLKKGETQKEMLLRQESEGLLSRSQSGKDIVFRKTEAGAHLSSQQDVGRLRGGEDGSFGTRKRIPAIPGNPTYLDAQRKDMALSRVQVQEAKSVAGEQLLKDAKVDSPSKETVQATQAMVEGVTATIEQSVPEVVAATEKMISPLAKPTQASEFSSSFGNINVKEPFAAVGNAPRQVVQAMSEEAASAKTFIGDIKTSFASMRENLGRELGWVKEEFKALTGGIKENTSSASQSSIDAVQRNLEITQAANNQILVDGEKAGFNYVAAMAGRDGAVEAVATKKTAELITNVTAAWNSGVREIPPIIPREMSKAAKKIDSVGKELTRISVDNEIKRKKALEGVQGAGVTNVAAEGGKAFGPQPQSAAGKLGSKLSEGFAGMSQNLSNASLAISALSGVASMFGGDLQGLTSTLSMVSGGMFALIQVTSALQKLQLVQIARTKRALVLEAIKDAKTVAAGVGAGFFATMVKIAAGALTALLGPIGLIVVAVAIAAAALIGVGFIVKKQMDRLEAFGKIIDVTADQIKFLGESAGEESVTETGFGTATASEMQEVSSSAAKSRAEDEEFTKQFAQQIQAIKDGGKKDIDEALNLLALKLSSSGLSDTLVKETLAGIIRASGKTDLIFDFNSVGVSEEKTDELINNFKKKAENVKGIDFFGNLKKDASLSLSLLMQSLSLQLENGIIDLDQYNNKMKDLIASVNAIQDVGKRGGVINSAIDNLITDDENLKEQIKNVEDLDKRLLLLQAAGGATNLVMTGLISSANNNSVSTADFTKEVNKNTKAQRENNDVQEEATALTEITNAAVMGLEEETLAINNKIEAYKILTDAGYDTEEALSLLNDEILIGQIVAEGGLASTRGAIDELIAARVALGEITSAGSSGSGGSVSDPIADAIKALKEQKQEIINTSKAFSELRKKGMDAAKAMKFAQNPQLMSAMSAGLKVGSKQWDEIIKRIKAAEIAAKKFQMTTASGQKQYFDEVYGKVQSFFSASENLMRSSFELATSADSSLISKLENKIKDLNSEIQSYEHALEDIAEKEEAINKEYDKKAKALENVRRVNEEILRQQKSQLSVAEALSKGDVSAAASAMQESRAESSRAALDGQGSLLDASKQAQLDALRAKNGLSREELEKRIRAIRKEVSEIERGELSQAEARIDKAQRKLDIDIKGIKALERTSEEWENIKAQTDLAETGALLYNKELRKSVGLVKEMVAAFAMVPGTVGFKPPPPKPDKKKKADGGFISGPGTATSDSIPAMLSDGEYVIKASSVSKFGKGFLDKVNAGIVPKYKMNFAGGGMVKLPNPEPAPVQLAGGGKVSKYAGGGMVKPSYFKDGGMALSNSNNLAMGESSEKALKSMLSSIGAMALGASKEFTSPVYPEISRSYQPGNPGGGLYASVSSGELSTQVDNSVYNYNLSVNVDGSDLDANDVASEVMKKLKFVQSQKLRNQVIR